MIITINISPVSSQQSLQFHTSSESKQSASLSLLQYEQKQQLLGEGAIWWTVVNAENAEFCVYVIFCMNCIVNNMNNVALQLQRGQ